MHPLDLLDEVMKLNTHLDIIGFYIPTDMWTQIAATKKARSNGTLRYRGRIIILDPHLHDTVDAIPLPSSLPSWVYNRPCDDSNQR